METIPRNDFDMRNRYDAFCKAVLRNEAKDYLREQARQRNREKSLDALTQEELDKLATVDHYPSDSYVFSSPGYDLLIDNELVADAFASLPERERQIVGMRFGLWGQQELTQKEVAQKMGISQSYISRLEKRIIDRLKKEILRMM